mgnify:CR=1 FL=1
MQKREEKGNWDENPSSRGHGWVLKMLIGLVREAIKRHEMVRPGDKVLVGVSGGPDSVALLHALYVLRGELEIALHVAHLNHMFRGREAEEDVRYVKNLAGRLGLPVTVREVDVPRLLKEKGGSPQEVAREVRYQFYREVASQVGANRVAVGQNMNDQAETLLMRLIRGTGLDGLAGIPVFRDGFVIRPLLGATREVIEEYCRAQGLEPREDTSNLKPVYTRNKIRHELLPLLEKEYNPCVVETLAKTADLLAHDREYLESQAEKAYRKLKFSLPQGYTALKIRDLLDLPLGLRRRVVRLAVAAVAGGAGEPGYGHVEEILSLTGRGKTGKKTRCPGNIWVVREAEHLVFGSQEPEGHGPGLVETRLVIPGETRVEGLGLVFRTRVIDADAAREKLDEVVDNEAYLDYNKLELPLLVRSRRPGDVFWPLGARGRKKLKDFFIDCKIPRREKEKVVILASARDIIWVVGYRIDERFKVSEDTKKVLAIYAKPYNEGANDQ